MGGGVNTTVECTMTRRSWVLVHRYAGLYMACFLIVAGLTGSLIAFYVEPRRNPATGEPYVLDFTELYLDPYSGEELGRRRFGEISQGVVNLMPFIYRFHYSLALGEIGTWLLGIAALIWTLDSFVGFYLTLPPWRYPHPNPPPLSQGRELPLLLPCSRLLRTGESAIRIKRREPSEYGMATASNP